MASCQMGENLAIIKVQQIEFSNLISASETQLCKTP